MTELDLGLKVGIRRVLWQTGSSTRLDVQLRGSRPAPQSDELPGRSSSGAESFTDLDVLGVVISPSLRIQTTLADCKTGRRDRPVSRMFWARGVADLFSADEVMLVRDLDVNDATRQLSHRLGITVVAAADLQRLQHLHGIDRITSGAVTDVLFDRAAVNDHLHAFTELDRRLRDLLEYRDFDYWVYEPHRNLVQLVAHLQAAAAFLDARNPVHLALLVDLAWMYTLTTTRAAARVRAAHLRDPDRGLQEYLFGGPINLQEKREMAAALRGLAPRAQDVRTHLPAYYAQLRELVARQLRRADRIQTVLRYAELASALMAARRRMALPDALADEFDPIAAKLLADVCGFLTAAAGLAPNFRAQVRAILLGEPTPTSPAHDHNARPQSATSHARADEADAAAAGSETAAASMPSPTSGSDAPAEVDLEVEVDPTDAPA